MSLRIVAGRTSRRLAGGVATELGLEVAPGTLEEFPDTELRPTVTGVRGDDVYVVCSTGPPVSANLVELLLLLDACRRAGSARVSAVVPYFGYARQDRRDRAGEAVGARLVADVLAAAGAHRVIVVDPHTPALEAMFGLPVEMLTAVPALADAVRPGLPEGTVIVAPDLGAAKPAEHYAALLGLPVAVVRKHRTSGTSVRAEDLAGDVAGRPVLIIDDMISTGGTIVAAAEVVAARGAAPNLAVAAAHGLFVGSAAERLRRLAPRRLVVTDTLDTTRTDLPHEVASVTQLLAEAIGRLHDDRSLDELLFRT